MAEMRIKFYLGDGEDGEISLDEDTVHITGPYMTMTSHSSSIILDHKQTVELHRALGEVIEKGGLGADENQLKEK